MNNEQQSNNQDEERSPKQEGKTAGDNVTNGSNRLGYQIPLGRMTIYHFATCGFFVYIWAFKHFMALLPKSKKASFTTGLKVVFPGLSFYGLLNGYEMKAKKHDLNISLNKKLYAWTYLFLIALFNILDNRINDPRLLFWLGIVENIQLVPLLLSQRNINQLLNRIEPESKPKKMHIAAKIAATLGILCYISLNTLVWFAPEITKYTEELDKESQATQMEEQPLNKSPEPIQIQSNPAK